MAFADRFVLGERAGTGATGEVLRAFDKVRGIPVAIKRLHEHLVADPFSRERFRSETCLSTRVESEHVVRCLEGGIDEDDRPYLVLEWLDGQDLAQHMKASRVSTADAIEITRQTALGLQAMHDAGIVHRDVKPGNLFVAHPEQGKPFVVKLLDLGVAYDANSQRPDGVALGTLFYMSPEQAQARSEIGPASDLFSLGALFFELLTGQRPFAGHTNFALLAKIALQVSPRLSAAWPHAPRSLETFIARAMARDPAARFSSAREMAQELEQLAQASLNAEDATDAQGAPLTEPNPDHLVAVVFGRLPLTSYMGRCRDVCHEIVQHHEGSVVTLLGRGVAALFHGECADGLLRAADAALVLAHRIVGGRWALVAGSALPPDAGLSESVIERGTRALERARTGANEASVRIDDETADLLEEHYVIEGGSGALSLRSTREAGSSRP
jgi:tRNA A-37 threonylcarbamoyl transferase component Bud32